MAPGNAADAVSATGNGVNDSGDADDFAAEEGVGRVKTLGAQLAEDVRTAAAALIDEQKSRAATQIDGVAEVLRRTARSLEESTGHAFAAYADRAAEQVEHMASTVRDRSWRVIRAEAEILARRQPAVFMLGTLVVGFIGGRFLTASSARQRAREANPAIALPRELN
jgi:hypothetical protein